MKTSFEFDNDFYEDFKKHATSQSKGVGELLVSIMKDELRRHGKLEGDPASDVIAIAGELTKVVGHEAVRDALQTLAGEAAERNGETPALKFGGVK